MMVMDLMPFFVGRRGALGALCHCDKGDKTIKRLG